MLRKLLIVTCLSSVVCFAFGQKKRKSNTDAVHLSAAEARINYIEPGSPLPPLKIFTKEGKYLSEHDLKNDAHLILMLFNPTCDHCEEQTFSFKDNIALFKKTQLVLIAAPNMGPHLEYFTNNTKLHGYHTIQVGIDSAQYIEKTFRQITLPQINVYDKERKLVKMFYGVTPIDSLKPFID